MHVPLLFVGPGVPAGKRVSTPVQTVDIAPTILAWAGLEPNAISDGGSLVPAFDGGTLPARIVYGESVSLRRLFAVSPLRYVREGRWKLVHKPTPELYDLDADPRETHNRAGDDVERVAALRSQLESLLTSAAQGADPAPGALDDQTRQQLESLGYVVGGSTPSDDASIDSIEVHGADPTVLMAKLDPYVDVLASARFSDAKQTSILLEQLSQQFPESSALLELLIDSQLRAGLTEAAIASLRRGIEIDPDHQRYWDSLGELLTGLGRDAEAKDVLSATLVRWPCDLEGRTRLVNVLSRTGESAQQIAVLEQGITQCDSPPQLVNDLAYLLATTPSAELRDGRRALELAQAMIGSLGDNPLALDTLAVAQAEAGQQREAEATLARAIEMAERQQLPDAALVVLRDHAARLRAGEPIRE
jgi:tetratricopeptide (TPR) repeat protein